MTSFPIEGSLTILDKGATYTNARGTLTLQGKLCKYAEVTSTTTAALVLTATDMIGGLYDLGTSGGSSSITTATAALILAAVPNFTTGMGFFFHLRNRSGGSVTLSAGSGVTLATGNTNTVANGSTRTFLVYATSTSAVSIYSVAVAAH